MKQCATCKETKPHTEFYKCKVTKGGYRASCKKCRNVVQRKSDEKNLERRRETRRKWEKNNPEKVRENRKRTKAKNRAEILRKSRAYAKKRYYTNLERERQRCRDWRKENPEVYAESNKKSCQKQYRKNREARLELSRKWKEENPEKVKELQRKYAARQREKFPEKAAARVMVRTAIKQGFLHRPENCSKCKKECKPEGHHEDYSKPLEVIWLCRKCHIAHHKQLEKENGHNSVQSVDIRS